jgi:hypothetical protein
MPQKTRKSENKRCHRKRGSRRIRDAIENEEVGQLQIRLIYTEAVSKDLININIMTGIQYKCADNISQSPDEHTACLTKREA